MNKVRIYDSSNGAYLRDGPDLVYGRYGHACAVFKETDSDRILVMAAGGYDKNSGSTVELFDYFTEEKSPGHGRWDLGNYRISSYSFRGNYSFLIWKSKGHST